MAWERRAKSAYYYRSVRVGSSVTKVYCGGGAAGRAAAEADAARRRRRQVDALAWQRERSSLESVAAAGRLYEEACALLAEAVLLAAGFRRAKRSPWRPWHAGREILNGARNGRRHC